jgi:outer membrane receptor protein involved in Fe transport
MAVSLVRASLVLTVVSIGTSAHAHDESELPPPPTAPVTAPEEVQVHGDRSEPDAASQSEIGHTELELRPRSERSGDLVEAVPGLFTAQHAGGGKADQYFLRGFDADHGTDVAFFVDGVPVNLPSHAHGQGFSDLHFVIPEMVVGVEGYKGPYYAEFGDFATAGAIGMSLARALPESFARAELGQDGMSRLVVAESPRLGDVWRAIVAVEAAHQDGPFVHPEDFNRLNLYARVTHDLGPRSELSLAWMSYESLWNGSGQIPARAVCGEGEPQNPPPSAYGAPCIDRFDSVDPTEGGGTQRHSVQLAFASRSDSADVTAMVYAVRYRFTLWSDFAFFADDPVHGDEIEQDDDRWVLGTDLRARRHDHWRGMTFTGTAGLQARNDSTEDQLWHDQARGHLSPTSLEGVTERGIGAFVEENARIAPWVRFVVVARADHVDVDVADHLGDASGLAGKTQLSPKWMAIVSPAPAVDIYADWGRGFHTNDARGVVLPNQAATLIVPATGYELGTRVRPLRGLDVTAAAFLLDLESELVWDGDTGTTQPSGPTRRYGLEVGGRWRLGNWFFADADATFTKAQYRVNAGNGDAVALAPTRTLTAGVGAMRKLGEWTPFGSLRLKSIADRSATPDGSLVAEGFTLVNAQAGVRWRDLEVGVDVLNLLNTTWREAQFATTSRLAFEPVAVTGIDYTPGWPFTAMAHATYYWR